MYDHGREFYARLIAEARIALSGAQNPYDIIIAQEKLEESKLKLVQLNRREKTLLTKRCGDGDNVTTS